MFMKQITNTIFRENVDHQIQYYAATKRANELMYIVIVVYKLKLMNKFLI